ncbi:hypothetical protein [Asticcacaulis solisilvae]|uniref:hypothetical protein n=1 Tax=Asticcacaulis solisilvae TaxID=1217274 RepID=UPI003FD89E08
MRFKLFAVTATMAMALSCAAGAQTSVPEPAPGPAPEPNIPPPPILVPPVPRDSASPAPSVKPNLKNATVYIYSYLDLREDHFGSDMLDKVDSKLTNGLKALDVSAKIVRYKSTEVYQQSLADDEYKATNRDVSNGFRESGAVPVQKVIAEKQVDEIASGAKYRLIVFPKAFTSSGAWRFYTVTWTLYDTATNRKVWSHAYDGRDMIWWRETENAEGRSQKMVDAFIGALTLDGLVQ